MSEHGIIYLVGMIGWLALVVGGYRSYKVNASRTLTYVLVWAALFGAGALIFGALM